MNDATPLKDQLFHEIKVAIIQLADNEDQKEQQENTANDKFDGITTAPVKNLLTGKWEEMDIEAMEDGTVIQSTYGVMCFKVVKKLFVEQVENYWVDRHGNIRSNIELAQSEEEEREFLRLFGWDVWDAPYDSHKRLMKHLALTAATHNTSVHSIVATGSFIETE